MHNIDLSIYHQEASNNNNNNNNNTTSKQASKQELEINKYPYLLTSITFRSFGIGIRAGAWFIVADFVHQFTGLCLTRRPCS